MSTGTSCFVYVDGVRAPDGSMPGDIDGPVVLENLSVTWGRGDTMTQPEPDSCSFDVLDFSTGGFSNRFRTGSLIEVLARGIVSGSESAPTFTNPSFETASVTWTPRGATAERTSQRARTGTQSLGVRLSDNGTAGRVFLAPAPFEEPGTNPDAWDAIPTTELGQTWTATVSLWIPTGAVVAVRPAFFTGPYDDAATGVGAFTVLSGDDEWQTFATAYIVQQSGAHWFGLEIQFFPNGRAWDEMPPTLAWDAVDPSLTWDDFGTLFIDDAQVTTPNTASAQSVLVFVGRVTGLSSAWDESGDAPLISVTANGFTADLQNRTVGDEPWNVESVEARADRILTLAALPVVIDIDTSVDQMLLSWRDVDSQGAFGLLQQIAVSVDGVLWPAVHSALGAYLRLEDPSLRIALLRLDEITSPPIVTVRTNLSTNPSFETVTLPWVTNNVTGNRSGEWAREGTYSWRAQSAAASGATVGDIRIGGATTFPPNIVPGGTYTISAWINTPAAHNSFSDAETSRQRRMLFFYSTNGVAFTQVKGAQAPNTAGVHRISLTFTVPANATGCIIAVGCAGSAQDPSFVTYIDAVLIEEGATLGEAFTGATADTATTEYAWTGGAHVSTSTATTTEASSRQIVIVQTDPDLGFDLSACNILRNPVSWVQSVADITTRVGVTWKLQGVNEEGLNTTTDVTERVIDVELEQRFGTRGVSVSTELQSAADADNVAQRVLTRTSSDAWRANGLTLDDEDLDGSEESVVLMLGLLDGTSRIGAPMVLGDLPTWSPAGATAGAYLEGGTYRFVGGRWVLEMIVSSGNSGLGASAQWDDLNPAWQWDHWDSSITWNDLRGVAAN